MSVNFAHPKHAIGSLPIPISKLMVWLPNPLTHVFGTLPLVGSQKLPTDFHS